VHLCVLCFVFRVIWLLAGGSDDVAERSMGLLVSVAYPAALAFLSQELGLS